ncbi:MAG: hypothetical protein H6739_01400 [Alphaproteobacteria bacterium]|nr:hypothetical protein [Alphaproteobacteria bacterium]
MTWLALLPLALADDASIVADALRRQEARLEAAGCPDIVPSLTEAAARLERDMQSGPREQAAALSWATLAVQQAVRVEGPCLGADVEPRRHARQVDEPLQRTRLQLRAWGERRAAAAWADLSAPARPEAPPPPRAVDGCRCMGTLVQGTPVSYGLPTGPGELLAALWVIELGGCVVGPDARRVSCPAGCQATAQRPGESPLQWFDWHIVASDGVSLGVRGSPEAVQRFKDDPPSPEALKAAEACVSEADQATARRPEGQDWLPVTGAWAFEVSQQAGDTCLAGWAADWLADPDLVRVAAVRGDVGAEPPPAD